MASDGVTSSSSSDSDTDPEVYDHFEKDFFKTLSSLKSKDPKIYDETVNFFKGGEDKEDQKANKAYSKKPMFPKDYKRKLILEKGGQISDDEDEVAKEQPYIDQQTQIKKEIKEALEKEDSSDGEECGGLLKKHVKTKKEKDQEEADFVQWLKGERSQLDNESEENDLKPLLDYWNDPNLDKKEEFLKDFILNKRYKKSSDNESNDSISGLSEDERILEAQEEYEHNFNLRFERGTDDFIKQYPRDIEGSVRRKDDRRKKKRGEVKERKVMEEKKKREVIVGKQKEKLKEIEAMIQRIQSATGNDSLGFDTQDILGDFDAEKHDERMREIFNDEYYSKEDLDESECTKELEGDDWNITDDFMDDNMDCEAEAPKKSKDTRTKRKKQQKKKSFSDIELVVKPVFDPAVHESYQKYIDEYFSLDCESFIDDMPCRYKYRTVEPNSYGLTVEEILLADDKELNKWHPLNKMMKLRPKHVEKNEAKIFMNKSRNELLKKKILPSLFENDKEGSPKNEDQSTSAKDTESSEGSPRKKRKVLRKKSSLAYLRIQDVCESSERTTEDTVQELEEGEIPDSPIKTRKRKRPHFISRNPRETLHQANRGTNKENGSGKRRRAKREESSSFSGSRLTAYGIKPNKFPKSR